MKKKVIKSKNLIIYQAKSGAIELRGDFKHETIWATQAQIAQLFSVTPQNITLHLNNIYKDNELNFRATCKESLQVRIEGNRKIERNIKFYNLDAIIAVGYRVNSVMGTNFRIWATKTLREHITKGYTINRAVVAKNYDSFMDAVTKVKALLPKDTSASTNDILELINLFANTWLSLDAYDKEKLSGKGSTKKNVTLTAENLWEDVISLKGELMNRNEATEFFAKEREQGALAGIVGNVMQSFGGQALYKTVEEKAAHLLYFIIKNHPFVDGNKRTGAYAFIWYLQKAKILNTKKLTPEALTAVTLLVAESNPNHKDKLIGVIVALIS